MVRGVGDVHVAFEGPEAEALYVFHLAPGKALQEVLLYGGLEPFLAPDFRDGLSDDVNLALAHGPAVRVVGDLVDVTLVDKGNQVSRIIDQMHMPRGHTGEYSQPVDSA